ncbi:hypothetical protein GM661_03805 [Iocasia frigidifontis]|uniref:Uncharacterized protein n=1 Tax=Iocasia fonsfrigidae TaxID=2682810 RepID=A0A8A7KH08_9FIRM|nr:hypothetical protein [Iocasia fonsfrigidae]QTL97162.1 hypothetical protein GM661_03805 [Iocasia fonsfrigidae]
MKLTIRERRLLTMAAIVISFISIYSWIYKPVSDYYFQQLEREIELSHRLDRNKMLIARGPKYREMIETATSKIEKYQQFFFHGSTAQLRLEVINTIDQEARNNNLNLKNKALSIYPGSEETTGNKLTLVEYRGNFTGSFRDILFFLNSLNKQKELYQLTELQLKGGENSDVLSLFIKIAVYCIGDDENEV